MEKYYCFTSQCMDYKRMYCTIGIFGGNGSFIQHDWNCNSRTES